MPQTFPADTPLYGGRELSPALENYLEIILRLELRDGAARAADIAEAAGVTRPTVTSALKSMKDMGLVEYAPYSRIRLTEEGYGVGRDISHRHLVFQEFLEAILLLQPEAADAAACMLEHAAPAEVVGRLRQFILYLKSRPELLEAWQNLKT